MRELSQPTFSPNKAGKMEINKTPEGTISPNLADAIMICYAMNRRPMRISKEVLRGI